MLVLMSLGWFGIAGLIGYVALKAVGFSKKGANYLNKLFDIQEDEQDVKFW